MPMVEGYMFEEHEMIRRAATECMCNLAMSQEVRAGSHHHVDARALVGFAQLTWSTPLFGHRYRTSLKPRATTG